MTFATCSRCLSRHTWAEPSGEIKASGLELGDFNVDESIELELDDGSSLSCGTPSSSWTRHSASWECSPSTAGTSVSRSRARESQSFEGTKSSLGTTT